MPSPQLEGALAGLIGGASRGLQRYAYGKLQEREREKERQRRLKDEEERRLERTDRLSTILQTFPDVTEKEANTFASAAVMGFNLPFEYLGVGETEKQKNAERLISYLPESIRPFYRDLYLNNPDAAIKGVTDRVLAEEQDAAKHDLHILSSQHLSEYIDSYNDPVTPKSQDLQNFLFTVNPKTGRTGLQEIGISLEPAQKRLGADGAKKMFFSLMEDMEQDDWTRKEQLTNRLFSKKFSDWSKKDFALADTMLKLSKKKIAGMYDMSKRAGISTQDYYRALGAVTSTYQYNDQFTIWSLEKDEKKRAELPGHEIFQRDFNLDGSPKHHKVMEFYENSRRRFALSVTQNKMYLQLKEAWSDKWTTLGEAEQKIRTANNDPNQNEFNQKYTKKDIQTILTQLVLEDVDKWRGVMSANEVNKKLKEFSKTKGHYLEGLTEEMIDQVYLHLVDF